MGDSTTASRVFDPIAAASSEAFAASASVWVTPKRASVPVTNWRVFGTLGGRDHMIARPNQGQHRRRDGRHAAGEEQRVLGAFERREPLFDFAHRGIAVSTIFLALGIEVSALHVAREIRRVREGKCRRLGNRRGDRMVRPFLRRARMDSLGGRRNL